MEFFCISGIIDDTSDSIAAGLERLARQELSATPKNWTL